MSTNDGTFRYVQCATCDAVYPKPQDGACGFCQEEPATWRDWNPAQHEAIGFRELPDLLEGLLALLEGADALADHDGRLYRAVVDALGLLALDGPTTMMAHLYQTDEEALCP